MRHPPLDVGTDWRMAWWVLPGWRRLHRVSELVPDRLHGHALGEGVTVCGQRGSLAMPGLFSRMGLPRCAHCCRILGCPPGDGAPYNHGLGVDGHGGERG